MEDERKSMKQLLRELAQLRRKVAELATSEAERKQAEEALASYREGLEELVEERTSRLMEASARLEEELAERKQAEEELASERNLLRTLMDNLPDPVVVKDLDERYVLANPAQARLFGLEDPQELVGKTFFDLYPEGLARPYPHADDQQVLLSGEPLISRERMIPDPDGQERWFLTSKVPLRDAGGSVVGLVAVGRDITERKHAEERIHDLARFPSENSNPVLRVSMDGDVIYANQTGRVLMESWEGQASQALPQEWLQALRGALGTESPATLELGVGDQTFSFTFAPVAGRDYVNVYGLDITERKQAEEELASERNLLRTLIDNLPNCIYAKDTESRFTLNNVANARLLGATTWDETIGKTDFDFHLHEMAQRYYADEQEILRTGQPLISREEPFIDPDGNTGWLLTTKVPLRDSTGEIVGLVGMGRDITERKQAEEALQESEERLRSILDSSPDLILQVDTQMTILWANKTALDMVPETVGQTCHKAYVHSDQVCQDCPCERALRTAEVEMTVMRHSAVEGVQGEGYWESIGVPTKDTEGRVVGAIEIARNVTDRVLAQQALREYSERLEEMVEERTRELREAQEELLRSEKLALLGEMAGAMSHELRNPLGAIKNAIYYLNMVLEEPDPEVKDTLDILNLEASNCARIVQDLLDFARSRPPVHVQIEVNDTVRGALSDIPVSEGVEVVTELDEGLPPILADAIQLNQVFGNIITNAFQAMPEGGRLLVRSRAAEGEGVAISFADTGVGITEENLGRMFQPLFTTKARGIGLGLAAVRLLVERHGGKVEVESEPGRGSTFTVWLPVGGAASGV